MSGLKARLEKLSATAEGLALMSAKTTGNHVGLLRRDGTVQELGEDTVYPSLDAFRRVAGERFIIVNFVAPGEA